MRRNFVLAMTIAGINGITTVSYAAAQKAAKQLPPVTADALGPQFSSTPAPAPAGSPWVPLDADHNGAPPPDTFDLLAHVHDHALSTADVQRWLCPEPWCSNGAVCRIGWSFRPPKAAG